MSGPTQRYATLGIFGNHSPRRDTRGSKAGPGFIRLLVPLVSASLAAVYGSMSGNHARIAQTSGRNRLPHVISTSYRRWAAVPI